MRAVPLTGLLAIALVTLASSVRADPTTDECIEANTKSQSLRRGGKLREAREQLLLCGSASCPKLVKDDCAQRMEEVERATPTIVFQVKDAQGRDLSDVKVAMDGSPLIDRIVGTAVQIDVGEHEFAFTADGFRPYSQRFIIVEAQKDRRETITLTSNAPVVVAPPPPPPEVVQPPPPPPPRVEQPVYVAPVVLDPAAVEARRTRRTTAIVLCVFGVLSLGGSVAFAVLGGQENTTIQAGGFATASDIANADSAGTAYNVALGVSLAGGLILAAIGLPLLLTSLGDGSPTSSHAASLRVNVGPTGLRLQW
jgi:hypothetical protein